MCAPTGARLAIAARRVAWGARTDGEIVVEVHISPIRGVIVVGITIAATPTLLRIEPAASPSHLFPQIRGRRLVEVDADGCTDAIHATTKHRAGKELVEVHYV